MSLSKKASLLKGALMVYLRPKMAADAKFDLDSLLEGVTEENLPEEKQALLQRIITALRGKLSPGASIGDLHQLLSALEGVPASEEGDEPEHKGPSPAMRRLSAEDRLTRFTGAEDSFESRFPSAKRISTV